MHALTRAGFFIHHATGSHYILKHPDKPQARVTLACHNKDLKQKVLEGIIKQSDMSHAEFLAWL
ncbi:MAG: type II toxin-antitoxin system HicA family toxin [Candidatus Sungbacteria bacterium]|nr:type II toxin-antitoxin system HicA family toxin [Candidatus Sungbacteria bacterium]